MNGYQLKINIEGSRIPIWRRVIVPAEITFNDLHDMIQILYNLCDYHLYQFIFDEGAVKVNGPSNGYNGESNVFYLEKIGDFLEVYKEFYYHYDLKDDWNFLIEVEKELENVQYFPIMLDYKGSNLIEECGGIDKYNDIIDGNDYDLSLLKVDQEVVNEELSELRIEPLLIDDELKEDYIVVLKTLKELINNREVEEFQVFKIIDDRVIYWVILRTIEGYVIELFESYEDILEGFYNLDMQGINHTFCRCYTFLIADEQLSFDLTLDPENSIAAFRNEPGYIPSLLTLEEAKEVIIALKNLTIALKNDNNSSEADEIIEIYLESGEYKESSIFVHEPKVDLGRYDYGYQGDEELITKKELDDRVSIDIITLPFSETPLNDELKLYAVVATRDDYFIKEIDYPSKRLMNQILIDILIAFFNEYGKPKKVIVNNLNILFLILGFLSAHEIDYLEGDTSLEIDEALFDAFGIESEMDEKTDNPFIENLLSQLEGKNEDEIEEKLDEILANLELLN